MGILRTDITMVSTSALLDRGEPKIGGSVGGFIALVVCLILVIVVACASIFFLIRQDSSEEQQRARQRQLRYQHQPVLSSSSYTYDPSSTPSKSWLASLQGIFPGTTRYNAVRRMKGRDGWIQATGDEWEDDSGDERLRSMGNTQYNAYSPALDPPFRPPGIVTTESTSTVHFVPRSDSRIPNRFTSSSESPTLSPVEIPAIPRSDSPESVSTIPQPPFPVPENRKDSVSSDISTRTSGSKFIEGI
jgi:hypothetical protein